MAEWRTALELDERRRPVRGDALALRAALRRGADLRVGTEFRHNEHIDTSSDRAERIAERMDFRVTYLIDDRWAAGIETLRMPVALPDGFGPRPSMSFFLYNEDGLQAIGRPYLDGVPPPESPPPLPLGRDPSMPRMNWLDAQDLDTNAPSHRFIYDFDYYRFFVCDRWRETLAHDAEGRVEAGSFRALTEAVDGGRELKLAVRGLAADLGDGPDHETFVHVGPSYQYLESGLLIAATHPVVRVRSAVPLVYASRAWDFGWLVVRTDGHVARWLCDPYTLRFTKSESRHAVRWFVES